MLGSGTTLLPVLIRAELQKYPDDTQAPALTLKETELGCTFFIVLVTVAQ